MKRLFYYMALGFFLIFTLITLYLSSSLIFDWFGIREVQGHYLMFIVWVNFIASILYIIALVGFVRNKKWTWKVLGGVSVMIFSAFIGLLLHIDSGGAFELKTIRAVLLRFLLTTALAGLAYFKFEKWRNVKN